METPIKAAIIIALGAVIVGGAGIAFKYWLFRKQQSIKTNEAFLVAGKKLIDAFEPTRQRIKNYRSHPHFFELMRFLIQEFPKYRDAVNGFRECLQPNEVEAFDNAWKQYHGNNENNPNFLQYQDHVPRGLLSRIDDILKFTR